MLQHPTCCECGAILIWSQYDLTGGCYYCPNCFHYSDEPMWDNILDARIRALEKVDLFTLLP